MKKLMSVFMTMIILVGVFTALCIVNAENTGGAYGDNNGSIEDNLNDIELESKEYPVKKGIIYAYPGITVAELCGTFTDCGEISVNDGNQAVARDLTISTGNTVNLKVDGYIVDTATLAVFGDVYPDGICNVTDITYAMNSIFNTASLSKIQFAAADVNRSNLLTVTDLVNMRNIIFNSADYKCLSPETGLYLTSQYVAGAYDKPMWEGNTVYQENAVVQKNESGEIEDIALLYKIDNIIEVRNYGLDKVYEYGTDYVLTAEGKIRIPEGSTIPSAANDAFLKDADASEYGFNSVDETKKVVLFGTGLHAYHISVTYTHSDSWGGYIPQDEFSRLDRFYSKLEKGENVTMLFYGDSISTGLNSSGCNESLSWKYNGSYSVYQEHNETINVAPYAPSWPRAIHARMQSKYPDATINYINVASSSSNSKTHGVRNLQEAVIDNNPDIVFIAFGTNEATDSKVTYKANQLTMLKGITDANPDCAVVFISPTIPNLNVKGYVNNNFALFEEAFYELQSQNPDLDIAVAPVNKVAQYVNSIKKYQDISGNNVNHPNDFGARIYSNTIMQVLGLYN